jgi:DNA invertase Pin-like site-specific DNA recombinase
MDLVAYLRVSTREQGDSGLGLPAQKRQIRRYAEAFDHRIVQWCQDVCSGKENFEARPAGAAALQALRNADGLIVAKLDRSSRDVPDGARLLQKLRNAGQHFLILDLNMDTSTATGELMAHVLLSLAQWERRIISERTAAALQEKKAQGARLGRPSTVTPEVRARIAGLRARGLSLEKIADKLNVEGLRTAAGAAWRHKAVGRALRTIELDKQAKEAARHAG